MIHEACCYDKVADITDIAPNSCLDITRMIETDSIPDNSSMSLFNQIENFEDIGGRVRNKFDVMDYQNAVTRIKGARSDDSTATV